MTAKRQTLILTLLLGSFSAAQVQAQADSPADPSGGRSAVAEVDSLVARALAVHPGIRAAGARVEAARAAVGPAGALPDPMLGIGIQNLPISEMPQSEGHGASEQEPEMMTMKTVGIGQTLPYPGKLSLRRRAAEFELRAAEAQREAARLAVVESVKKSYYELAFLDRALEILERNRDLLATFVEVTQAHYEVGTGGQPDVLKARVEVARLAEEAVALTEQRRAALARLNATLDRPSDTPVTGPHVSARIARATVAENAGEIRFSSAVLGARAANSPLPPLEELQEAAVQNSPMIREHEAMIAAQAARVELAGKEYLPDFELSIEYGQRSDLPDMISAMVSIPLPIRKGQRQDLMVREAEATLAELEAGHHEKANEIRAEVAKAYADLERDRAQLALYVKSILPQGRAALESATASFQVGREDLLMLLENQATLFAYETQYFRTLTEFAGRLAELERVVGKEIL